jgi:hypothetical protein
MSAGSVYAGISGASIAISGSTCPMFGGFPSKTAPLARPPARAEIVN